MVELENPAEEEESEMVMKEKNEEKIKKQQEFEIMEAEKIEEALRKNSENKFDYGKWGLILLVAIFVIGLGIIFLG